MGIWLFLAIILQLACAISAAKLGRPAVWLHAILLVPLLGSLAYCGFEIWQGLARLSPRPAIPHTAPRQTDTTLGSLGYQAVQARTADSRLALAEECLRVGRHADARLLFESCMVGRDRRDPRLIAGMERATALMDRPVGPTRPDETGTSLVR